MPRMRQIAAAQERDELFATLKSASYLRVRTRFMLHESQETPAMLAFAPQGEGNVAELFARLAAAEGAVPCPCCGSLTALLVETIDDLEVLVNVDTRQRWNRWENDAEDELRFRAIADQAQPYGTPMANVWDVPIDFTCSREAMAEIIDDRSRVIYWSGGWRSRKSHTASQWWVRGWVLHGSRGELFWLVGPELKVAFRLMTRIFLGRGETTAQGWQRGRSVAPKYFDPDQGTWRSMIARSLPEHEKVALQSFEMIDGSIVEHRHTKSVAALEGDTVRRALYDEAIRSTGPEGYEILLGRVQQGGGQLGIASVPGDEDEGWWLYEKVVQPAEAGADDKRLVTITSYDNLWIPHYEVKAGEESHGDDDELVQRVVYGNWNRAGGMAYGEAWKPATMAPMTVMEAHRPESWGFKHDVTEAVAIALVGAKRGKGRTFLTARDWNLIQCGIVGKVFAHDELDRTTWALVILDEHQAKGDAAHAAVDFTERYRSGFYRDKTAGVADRMGFFKGHVYEGKASESSDAYEFETRGVPLVPPLKTEAGQPAVPGVPESKKLLRGLMNGNRFFVDGQVCLRVVAAMPHVKAGEKRRRDAGTHYDRHTMAWDDCCRYLAWAVFGDLQPKPAKVKRRYRIGHAKR